MTHRERHKRPEVERTQPIRNWGGAFGAQGRHSPPGVPNGAPPHGHAPRDPVSRGVEAGYRVIDDYLRQGQAAARAMWSPFIPGFQQQQQQGAPSAGGPPPFSAWTGGGAPWGGPPPIADEMQQRMGTMMRYATDLAMMWMDFVGMGGVAGGPPRPQGAPPFTAGTHPGAPAPQPAATPAREAAAAPADQATVVTLAITSTRPVEVSVDLRPRSSGLQLTVHDLRAHGDHRHRLGHVVIETKPEDDQVTVRLKVPDDLAPGVYSGMIIDERSSLPRGTLTLRVPE